MRTLFVLILIAMLMALTIATVVEKDAGYVLIAYDQQAIEMSLAAGIVIVVMLFATSYVLLRLISHMLAPGGTFSRWLRGQQQSRTQRQTTAGLLAFVEGNWEKSRKVLAKSASRSPAPVVNYLIAARASQAMGAKEESQTFLRKAEQHVDGNHIALGITQAELQLQNGQYEESLATLTRLQKNEPKNPVILKLLLQAYKEVKDWEKLQALLPALRKTKGVFLENFDQLQEEVYCSLLSQVAQQGGENASGRLLSIWQNLPSEIYKDVRAVEAYAQALLSVNAIAEAEGILRFTLQRSWDDKLVSLYGKACSQEPDKQLLLAEGWLKSRPNNADLLLCLGRLSLANQLWGKAREYFESSLKLEKKLETYAELGRLLAHLGEHEKSTECYQQGLLLSTHGLPALPQPKTSVAIAGV